jgi:preprotein translocase subunit SecF/SecD/SecF fusion protein
MSKKQFDFIGKRKLFLLISVAILVAGLITNLFLPTELDINFKGGAIFTYSFTGDVDQSAVTEIAKEHLGEEAEMYFYFATGMDIDNYVSLKAQNLNNYLANK